MREKWWDFEISVILYSQCCCFLFYFKKIHFDFFHEHYKHYDVKQTKKNIPKYYQPNTTLHTVHMCNVAYALRNAKSKIHKRLTMKEDDSILLVYLPICLWSYF